MYRVLPSNVLNVPYRSSVSNLSDLPRDVDGTTIAEKSVEELKNLLAASHDKLRRLGLKRSQRVGN